MLSGVQLRITHPNQILLQASELVTKSTTLSLAIIQSQNYFFFLLVAEIYNVMLICIELVLGQLSKHK